MKIFKKMDAINAQLSYYLHVYKLGLGFWLGLGLGLDLGSGLDLK